MFESDESYQNSDHRDHLKILDEMLVIDNVISEHHQNYIEQLCFGHKFPWFYNFDPTFPNRVSERGTTFSSLLLSKDTKSEYFQIFLPIAFNVYNTLNLQDASIFNCRAFLHIKNESKLDDRRDQLHVDQDFPHLAMIYYVNDADGPTEIVDEGKIIKRVDPKKGRLLVFDGQFEHRSNHPQYNDRCIINFNLDPIPNTKYNMVEANNTKVEESDGMEIHVPQNSPKTVTLAVD
tara:strand:+ start:224 stop:925 length:702 start_codon:yes stop_codon:yes gene_type:complete